MVCVYVYGIHILVAVSNVRRVSVFVRQDDAQREYTRCGIQIVIIY